MVDQHILKLPTSGSDRLTSVDEVNQKILELLEDGIIREAIPANERNLNCVVHGPFSSFDLRSYGKDGKPPEKREDATGLKEVDISSELKSRFILLDDDRKTIFRQAYRGLKNLENEAGILGYEPTPLGRLNSDIHISTTDYLAMFLLELYSELNNMQHSGSRTVVLHPDALFYIAGNSEEGLVRVAKHLDVIAKSLKCRLVFENVVFGKGTYKEAFPWAENIAGLNRIINSCPNLGMCIDVMHLLRISQNGNQEVMAQNAIEMIMYLARKGKPVVIHSRASNGITRGIDSKHEVMGKVISEAYKRGIPVVYEPDNY